MADRRVVDTSVISLYLKATPTPDAAQYDQHLVGFDLIMSFMTLAELLRWSIERGWGHARINRMELYLVSNYAVFYADELLCRTWARLAANLRASGIGLGDNDRWIAATALALTVPLVTHNRRHFDRVPGLTVISEAP